MNHAVFWVTPMSAVEFIAADAVLAIGEQPDGREPLIEADGRVFKYGPNLERELLLLVVAVAAIDVRLRQPSQLGCAAIRASRNAIRPAHENHERRQFSLSRKVLNRLL